MTLSSASIAVDRMSPVPLYYQVAQQLEQLIEAGELPPGTRLNNELVLADQLGLSRPTLRRAIEYLVDRGYLVRKRGVGTQVVNLKVRRPVELTSLYDDLSLSGKDPRTTVLSLKTPPATDVVAHALGVDEGSPVIALERLRYADGEPLAVMRNWIPPGLVELTPELLERRGLYQVMRAAGLRLHLASQTIGARAATAAEARLLHATRGEPLLTMERTTYDDAGRTLEFADHFYRASLYSFEIVLVAR
ncbi:MAG TPA: GntR family transcriptional regulator [Actinomycetes bacterium]|jgi:DNA-binding GntR family transcriptional regulator|nr:GntR family transcriptional regulator [Actinomycetes bacterium]